MVVGKYELKIAYDVVNGKARKELMLTAPFANSEDFISKLLNDIGTHAPVLDAFIPEPEEKEDA